MKEPAEETGKFHVVVDIVDSLSLVDLKRCTNRSRVMQVDPIQCSGEKVAVFNRHAHSICRI